MADESSANGIRRPRPELGPYVAPRTENERRVAGIVSEILGLERVGMEDGFLALGGDSLAATLLAVQLQDSFGFTVDPSIIFDSDDLAALSAAIGRAAEPPKRGTVLAPSIQNRPERIPLSSEQQILVWLHQMNDDKAGYNIARAIRIRGTIDPDLLGAALGALLDRHEILRTRFETADGTLAQVIDPAAEAVLELVDLSTMDGQVREDEARRTAARFVRRPFAVDRERLFRVCLVQLAEDDQVLAVSMHHLVSDGGSLLLIFGEIGALYAAHATGEAMPPGHMLQYADYALWQSAAYAALEERQIGFWSAYLDGVRATRWARPAPPPEARRYRLGAHALSLSPELTHKLRELARSQDVTVAMILFAANQMILASLCGGVEDIVGGMTFSRRTRPEFQDVAGPMLVTYPVRTPIRPHDTFQDLLRQVKSTLLEVYGHLEIDGAAMARRMTTQPWPMTNFNLIGDRSGPAKRLEQSLKAVDRAIEVAAFPTPEAEDGTAPIDFSIELYEDADRIVGKIVYGLDVFDSDAIADTAEHFRALLARAAEDPGRSLSELTPPR